MEKIDFTAADGYTLRGIWMRPPGPVRGTILFNSATGVKKEYYLPFAGYLVQNGYAVLLYDYRGIGGSAPARLKGFTAYMHEWGTLDMNAALDYLVLHKSVHEVIWAGHSVGAQLMGLLNNRHRISKVLAINASTGYWGYFPFPYNWMVLSLWMFIGPPLTLLYGYAPMHKLGWGEPLPSGVYFEWRRWCLSQQHFTAFLQTHIGADHFADFTAPITAVHTSDDYIANSTTVQCLLGFYPNAPAQVHCIRISAYGLKAVGHTGIFRKRFQNQLWPILIEAIEQ